MRDEMEVLLLSHFVMNCVSLCVKEPSQSIYLCNSPREYSLWRRVRDSYTSPDPNTTPIFVDLVLWEEEIIVDRGPLVLFDCELIFDLGEGFNLVLR